MRARAALIAVVLAHTLLLVGEAVQGQSVSELQQQIQESRERLEEIRAERERLQRDMQTARTRAANVSVELQNIERQLSASRSALAEMDFQAEAVEAQVKAVTTSLLRTRERLRSSDATLNRRLRDIYKLGALHTARVLLGAESFSDLLTRYRYLRLIASYDRVLVDQVGELEASLSDQDTELRESLRELSRLRLAREGEVTQLRSVELDRQSALARFRGQERQAQGRLQRLEEDEARLTGLVDDLERRRVEAERARVASGRAAAPSTLSASDAGSLPWPVQGDLIYRFGRERRPNGTVLRWNGVGIAAGPGAPVQAVRDGTVVLAGPFEGYGPTVVLSHGNGFYTLYLYLEDIGVVQGREVRAGQVVGTVGGQDTPEGPHLEFQIRTPSETGTPVARDPLQWLQSGGGGQP